MDVAHPTNLARAIRGRLSRYAMTAIPIIVTDKLTAAAQRLHQTILSVRARDPAATGPPAIQVVLGRSGLSSGQDSTGPNGETVLVLPVAARDQWRRVELFRHQPRRVTSG
jgi:hypothetical protein